LSYSGKAHPPLCAVKGTRRPVEYVGEKRNLLNFHSSWVEDRREGTFPSGAAVSLRSQKTHDEDPLQRETPQKKRNELLDTLRNFKMAQFNCCLPGLERCWRHGKKRLVRFQRQGQDKKAGIGPQGEGGKRRKLSLKKPSRGEELGY